MSNEIIENLKKKGVQNPYQLIKDVEEDLFDNLDMVHTLIKDYVKTYDIDDFMSWLEWRKKTIEDYKKEINDGTFEI